MRCTPVLSESNGVCEFLVLKIKVFEREIFLINIYRPPNCTPLNFLHPLELINECDGIRDGCCEMIITGDFNMPRCIWDRHGNITVCHDRKNGKILEEFMQTRLLKQHVTLPTRGNNILDLVVSNGHDTIETIEISPTIHSDHNVQKIETNISKYKTQQKSVKSTLPLSDINFHKTNWEQVNNGLRQVMWESTLQDLNPEECWLKIENILTSLLYENSSVKESTNGKSLSKEHRYRKSLMRKRTKLVKILNRKKNNLYSNEIKIKEIERKLRISHEEEDRRKELQAITAIKSDSRTFFSFAKRKAVIRADIGPLENG